MLLILKGNCVDTSGFLNNQYMGLTQPNSAALLSYMPKKKKRGNAVILHDT